MTHFFKKPIVKAIITVGLSALAAGLAIRLRNLK